MKNDIQLLVVMLHIKTLMEQNKKILNLLIKRKLKKKGVEAYIKEDYSKYPDVRIDCKSNWISLRLIKCFLLFLF